MTHRQAVLGILAGLALAGPVGAQSAFTIEDVAFLAGCWAGQMGDLEVREQWTRPEGGVMLGTTRFLRDGELVDWEFGRIVVEGGTVTLWPYPKGVMSEHGFPLVRADGDYVFENLLHDFPVRIVYTREGRDRVTPRVEGRDGQGPSWPLTRVACNRGARLR